MATGHNEQPRPAATLRVGLIAGDDLVEPLAEAIRAAGVIEAVAQGGMPRAAAMEGVAWYDDLRVLAAQVEVEALIVAASAQAAGEVAAIAAAEGKPLWQLPPLGRGFAGALEAADRMRAAERPWWIVVCSNGGMSQVARTSAMPSASYRIVTTATPSVSRGGAERGRRHAPTAAVMLSGIPRSPVSASSAA